jgi:hypothetical protein
MAQQTFEEIVDAVMQAESRGKRYAADGKTLTTSPKGALGEMQVMPKTSRDPGFGVVPARDKSPDEIARVGKDYLQAMLGKYGDTEKALIAYNWGPGVTDKWLAAGANPDKLPAETRTYVQRVKGFLGGKDVPRETSVAKKEREPLPASLPPMAQADIKTPTIKPEAAARVASLGPGYQAALALSFLAETDDEEDRKTTITQEYLAKAQEEEDDRAASAAIAKRQSNVFADLSNTTIRSPFAEPQQPVMMAEGGDPKNAKSLMDKFKDLAFEYGKDPIAFMREYKVPTSPMGVGLTAGYAAYKHVTGKDPLLDLQKELSQRLNPEIDTGDTESMPISVGLPPVRRANGSPEEGERLTPQQIERIAAQGPTERKDEPFFDAASRTYVDVLTGRRTPITEKDFTAREQIAMMDAVRRSQARGGEGRVDYEDYPDSKTAGPDYVDIRNTLGGFQYKQGPDGSTIITDKYDFHGPRVAEYEKMGSGERLVKSAKNALMELVKSGGPRDLAGELGRAYVGSKGPDVNIRIPVNRAEGSPKEGERKLDRETMDMLRRQGTSPASLTRVAPPADISSSAAGLPGLMLLADPRIDQTNAYGYMLDGGDDTKNRAMAQAMFLNKSRSEDYPDTIAHETEHLLARQNLGSAANINSKFDELIGNKGTSRLNFVRDAVKAAPYLKEKYDLQSSYLDPKMFEFQTKFGLGKNLLYEQLASLAALEQRHKIDLTKDPELRKTLFSRPDVRETYNALTGLRQTRLDPRDLPPHTRVAEPGMLDAIKGVFKRAEGGPVYRANGSPEEGEVAPRLTMQQIERLAAQEAAEREAASNAAFIAQKSGIGRKAGNISNALNTGTAYPAIAAGAMDLPYDLAGLPVDLTTMAMRPFGYSEQKPVFGSEYFKEMATEAGIRRPTPTDPTLKGFHTFGQVGAGLLAPGKIIQGAQALKGAAAEALAGFRAGRAEKPGMTDLMTGQRFEATPLTPQQQAEQRTVEALFDNLAGANQPQIAADIAAGRLPAYLAPQANPQLTAAQIQAQNIARLPQDAQEQLRLFEEAAARPRPFAIRRQGPAPEIVQPPPTTAVAITQPATKLPPPPPFVAPPVSAEFPFVGRLDEFAAGMTGPAQKEQLINQVKGKFREQDVARLEDALAGLGPKDKVTPAMLQQALANTYPPSRYRSVEITATNPMYQDVDNVFSQDKQIAGSMNLYLKESPESEALFNNYLGIKTAAQKAFSSYKPEDINLALDSLKNNPLSATVPEINVLIDRVEEALPTITRFSNMQKELNEIETLFIYPVIYKGNGFDFFPEALRRARLTGEGMDPVLYNRTKYDILKQEESKLIEELMQKGSDKLVALGGDPVDVKAFVQRHANEPNLYHAGGADDIIKEHLRNNVTPINDGIAAAFKRVKENIADVYSKVDEKLQPYTGYAGRHRAVTGGDNMPIGFSRFTEHTVDIDGRQLKGRHVHELQSDLSKDVKELGPKGRSLEKDQKELDNLLAKETKLTQEQTALATQLDAMPDNDPLINKTSQNFLNLNAEIVKLEQRKNVLETRILGPKSTEAPYERDITKRKSNYVLEEPFANFEAAPAVEMQLLIKNAIQSSIRSGQDFVTFPGKESKQAQLYEKLLPNLKQAVKDLGGEKAGFEIKPITLPNPTGDSPTVYGVIWSPETAAKAIEKGVPFNKGGMVERKVDDNRRYM